MRSLATSVTSPRDRMLASDESAVVFQEPFATINLPRELRDRIYRELLVAEKTRDPRDHLLAYDLEPAILRVNKQTHEEAARVLYQENTWILFEIHSERLLYALYLPNTHLAFPANIESYPDLPSLKVDIHVPTADNNYMNILIARCDLCCFFMGLVDLARRESTNYGWESLDFDLRFYGRNRQEEESLVDVFRDVRGAGRVSVTGTWLLSTGRELATLMMTPIAHINEIHERVSIYQARGDKDFTSLKYQEAIETYRHGFKYVDSLKYHQPKDWPTGELEGATSAKIQSLDFKYLSLWFACALCNLKLGHDMFDDFNDAYKTVLYKGPAIVGDSFRKAVELLKGDEPKEGLEMVLSIMRECPAHQRVDEEIDYMEAQLRSIIPDTIRLPTGRRDSTQNPLSLVSRRSG